MLHTNAEIVVDSQAPSPPTTTKRSTSRNKKQPQLRSTCDGCQAAKTRCSHESPCNRCRHHKMPCIYSISRRMGRPRRRHPYPTADCAREARRLRQEQNDSLDAEEDDGLARHKISNDETITLIRTPPARAVSPGDDLELWSSLDLDLELNFDDMVPDMEGSSTPPANAICSDSMFQHFTFNGNGTSNGSGNGSGSGPSHAGSGPRDSGERQHQDHQHQDHQHHHQYQYQDDDGGDRARGYIMCNEPEPAGSLIPDLIPVSITINPDYEVQDNLEHAGRNTDCHPSARRGNLESRQLSAQCSCYESTLQRLADLDRACLTTGDRCSVDTVLILEHKIRTQVTTVLQCHICCSAGTGPLILLATATDNVVSLLNQVLKPDQVVLQHAGSTKQDDGCSKILPIHETFAQLRLGGDTVPTGIARKFVVQMIQKRLRSFAKIISHLQQSMEGNVLARRSDTGVKIAAETYRNIHSLIGRVELYYPPP